MMRYEANVTVYDEEENVVTAETALGETSRECSRNAGALRNRLERAAEASGVDGANGWVEEPHRA